MTISHRNQKSRSIHPRAPVPWPGFFWRPGAVTTVIPVIPARTSRGAPDLLKVKPTSRCEFGVKVSLAVTHKEGFCVGIQTCPGNPFDDHTLEGQLDQVKWLTGKLPAMTFVDKGYKGHGVTEERSQVLISGTRKLSYALKRHLRRRSAVEPEIGHMKADGLLGRNFLKGMAGDSMNAILCGAGHNLRKILARLRALLCLFTGEARKVPADLIAYLEASSHPQSAPRTA